VQVLDGKKLVAISWVSAYPGPGRERTYNTVTESARLQQHCHFDDRRWLLHVWKRSRDVQLGLSAICICSAGRLVSGQMQWRYIDRRDTLDVYFSSGPGLGPARVVDVLHTVASYSDTVIVYGWVMMIPANTSNMRYQIRCYV
jgi:hypothetical protein